MTSSATPWFYHRTLSQQFEQSLQQARQAGIITAGQHLWLQALVADQDNARQGGPRVDRLSLEQPAALQGELASAWLISDPTDAHAPVFLHSLLNGLEAFASRQALNQVLSQRFSLRPAAVIEAERVEGNPFVQRMQHALEQQVGHLQALSVRLDSLPSLRTVLGKRLQQGIPEPHIDVFSHLLQLQITDGPDSVVCIGTQTLADAALQSYGKRVEGVADPLSRGFMDTAGRLLDAEQASSWAAAVHQAGQDLASFYERQLNDYWGVGHTHREFIAAALAESFRQALLHGAASQLLTPYQVRRLGALLFTPDIDPRVCQAWQPSLLLSGPAVPKLAGVFVLEFIDPQLLGVYLFSAPEGLQHFTDRQQLERYFQSPASLTRLMRLTSLDEHQALREQQVLRVRLDAIAQPLFGKMLDSIIALLKRNLQHVLGLPAIHPLREAVRIDDALDIRHLLDRRLLAVHDTWRWPSGEEDFARRWAATQTVSQFTAEQLGNAMYSPASPWYGQLSTLGLLLERHCQFYERAAGCLRQMLNRYLAMQDNGELDARDLWVHHHGTRTRLISLALERISGHVSEALPASARLTAADPQLPGAQDSLLPADLLDWLLVRVQDDFAAGYALHLRQFFSRSLRWLDTQVRPPMTHELILDAALRLDLSMTRRESSPGTVGPELLQQVLDRPLRSLRVALGEQCVEAHSLQLLYDPQQPALAVGNALVLTRAGEPGRHVLWSSCTGLTTHLTLAELESYLQASFDSPVMRPAWMSLLAAAERERLQRHMDGLAGALRLQVRLTRLDGHALQALQQAAVDRRCEEVARVLDRARLWRLGADTLRHVLKSGECNDPLRQMLDRLGINIEIMVTDELLPQWMKDASIWQLFNLSAFIERWYIACQSGQDFLFGIAEPHDYARSRLLKRLAADYPGQDLDPDRITVTLTRYTAAPVAIGEVPQGLPAATHRQSTSLTAYAIGRFGAIQDGTLSVSMDDARAQVTLSADYLRTLIGDLDIAGNYRILLRNSFSVGQSGHATRLKSYTEQVPPLELLRTYALHIRNELSAEGFRFIEAVLTMPDAELRLPVLGCNIVISPLLLCAAPDLPADRVPGAFVIAPQAPRSGPWLLYTLFNADFHVQEYADQAALLHAVRNDVQLQGFMLDRLPEPSRRLYANGGFMEPHIPFSVESDLEMPWPAPAPVTLVMAPISGNALHALFDSTGEILLWWFTRLSVSTAESDRAATTFLWSLGAEQVLALLPGRLGALVGLWQGKSLLHDTAIDVLQMHWGKAAAELLAGIGVLLTTRRGREKELSEHETSEPVAGGHNRPENPTFGWGNDSLTPELWSRLRAYQVQDLDLASLIRDPLVSTYQDAANARTYASVGGAMYRIEKDEYGWFIVGEQGQGPRLAMRQGQWQLNLQRGLRGGGGILTRITSGLISAEVDQVLIVEAHGMGEIRRKFRTRAQDIALAHTQAREYLENSLDNLEQRLAVGAHHQQVETIFRDFFDIHQPPPSLYEAVGDRVRRLYAALMDESLSPINSQRYVVGIRRSSLDEVTAFSFPDEPAKRIYLTERFFRDPTCRLKPQVLSRSRFNQGQHYRATVLIHELSHLYCGTEDLAYIDAHVPFVDLLEDHSDYRRMIKSEIVAQQRGLSWRTPRSELFRIQRSDGNWYDLTEKNAKARIRQITGKHRLEDARDVFYGNESLRSEVILANADSVALLVTLLGRERLAP